MTEYNLQQLLKKLKIGDVAHSFYPSDYVKHTIKRKKEGIIIQVCPKHGKDSDEIFISNNTNFMISSFKIKK